MFLSARAERNQRHAQGGISISPLGKPPKKRPARGLRPLLETPPGKALSREGGTGGTLPRGGTSNRGVEAPLIGRFKEEIVKRREIEIPPLNCSLGTFSHEKVPPPSCPQAKMKAV